ncbi:MAG: FHA domain-containing protein [bacterium]|nr:FHA domain-containing protein [bacterium]
MEKSRDRAAESRNRTAAIRYAGYGAEEKTRPPFGYPSSHTESAKQYVAEEQHTIPPSDYRAEKRTDGRMDSSAEKRKALESRTRGMLEKKLGIDPVVGWLVCIEGSEKGKDFCVRGKINIIGSSSGADICLTKDDTISHTHARLAYDPRHNVFRLLPGNNMNNIYLNEEPIYEAAILHSYDVIVLGETTLLFIPLCSERFNWERGLDTWKDRLGDTSERRI